MGDMAVGVTAINVAGKEAELPFMTAFLFRNSINLLVCLAVWLCYSARTTTDNNRFYSFSNNCFCVQQALSIASLICSLFLMQCLSATMQHSWQVKVLNPHYKLPHLYLPLKRL